MADPRFILASNCQTYRDGRTHINPKIRLKKMVKKCDGDGGQEPYSGVSVQIVISNRRNLRYASVTSPDFV